MTNLSNTNCIGNLTERGHWLFYQSYILYQGGQRWFRWSRLSAIFLICICIALITLSCGYSAAATASTVTSLSSTRMPIPAGAVQATVVKVVDGDTIDVALKGKEIRVRYIGVNTPETKKPNSPVEYYGHEAEQANQKLVQGKKVYLVFDVERTDRYGRTLAYVWLEPSTFVNAWLVEQGFAQVATYPPNVRYASIFVQMQNNARNANRGLWGRSSVVVNTSVKPASTASSPASGVIIQTVDLDGEFVVILNTGKTEVNLTGWRLVSEVGGQTYNFPTGTVLKPGASLRITSGPANKASAGTHKWTEAMVWNNSGDPALLYDPLGKLIARFDN